MPRGSKCLLIARASMPLPRLLLPWHMHMPRHAQHARCMRMPARAPKPLDTLACGEPCFLSTQAASNVYGSCPSCALSPCRLSRRLTPFLNTPCNPVIKPPPGQVIGYTITVTNDGTITATNVVVIDSGVDGLNCTGAYDIAPNAQLICTATYTVTQEDLDRGGNITNVATVNSSTPGVPPGNPEVEVPVFPNPSLKITKVANVSQVTAAGGCLA